MTATAVLTACGAGQTANTTTLYSPTSGAVGQVGPVAISNIIVVVDASGAEVYGGLANNGGQPDALTALSVSDADPVSLSDGIVEIPAGGSVLLGPGGTRAFVHNLQVPAGHLVNVTLQLRDAGHVTLTTLVSTQENLRAGS
ncbi:MAG: copper chaperone PCu(A)C [Actinomycetes bacterium]